MKKWMMMMVAIAIGCMVQAQGVYTKPCTDKALEKKAQKWMKKGKWRQGFNANPHASVNAVEFYTQYLKNPAQWEAMFRWLANNDLTAIEGGKHAIEGTSMTVSVEDSENGPLEKRRSESHKTHIDFQFVVKGCERFGIIDHETSKPNSKYRPDVIHYDYDKEKARFYDSTTDSFFLFFPDDWHIAKINTDGDDQNIRVVVVKLDYVE